MGGAVNTLTLAARDYWTACLWLRSRCPLAENVHSLRWNGLQALANLGGSTNSPAVAARALRTYREATGLIPVELPCDVGA